jgi:hypothetical protein
MIDLRPILFAAAAATAISAPANAETFTLFIYETPQELALRSSHGDEGRAYWADYASFAAVLEAAHAIRGGAPLAPPEDTVSFSGAGRRVGGDAKSSLALSGYFQIEADSLASAERLAAQSPSVRRGGRTEVRASYPAPAMPSSGPVAQ